MIKSLMKLDGPPILFVDLDGTVRKGKGELGHFVNEPKDVDVFPEAVERMKEWRDEDEGIVLGVTNQGGIALGYMWSETNVMIEEETKKQCEGNLLKIFTCMHGPKAGCFCRKPMPGLIIEAMAWARVMFSTPARDRCLMVGDMSSDANAAHAAGLAFQCAECWRAGRSRAECNADHTLVT